MALPMLGLGCHSVDVRSVADPQTDFSQFHTYAFAEPGLAAGHAGLTERNRMRIQTAIAAEMTKRSFRVAEQSQLLLSIDLGTSVKTYDRSNPNVENGSLGPNLSRHYGLKYDKSLGSEPVVDYREGSLSFRAVDTKRNRVVWEGIAVGMLYQNRPDKQVQERIREAVRAVFARFPIKPKQE